MYRMIPLLAKKKLISAREGEGFSLITVRYVTDIKLRLSSTGEELLSSKKRGINMASRRERVNERCPPLR